MKNLKKKLSYAIYLILVAFLFTSCADLSPHAQDCVTSNPSGFWYGLWHGIILPVSWIVSLFSDNVAIYDLDNNGGWYDFGFVLGLGALGGGSNTVTK